MSIDFSSDVGRVRLRIGDVSDLPFLSDAVIIDAIQENDNSLPRASQLCAQYILAQLAFKSHKKMVQLEVWGAEAFENYRKFLIDTVSNPAFIGSTYPIPYGVNSTDTKDPVEQFIKDWNNNWGRYTVNENMSLTAWGNNVGF